MNPRHRLISTLFHHLPHFPTIFTLYALHKKPQKNSQPPSYTPNPNPPIPAISTRRYRYPPQISLARQVPVESAAVELHVRATDFTHEREPSRLSLQIRPDVETGE